MERDEIIEIARQAGLEDTDFPFDEWEPVELIAFAKLVAEAAASKEREHWKEIVEGQLRCITALNDIVGGEGSTTTKNILDYSRMEERIKEAVLEERKACLKICEAQAQTNYWEGADVCAEDIRARGEAQ